MASGQDLMEKNRQDKKYWNASLPALGHAEGGSAFCFNTDFHPSENGVAD